jgi:hypothetical protein
MSTPYRKNIGLLTAGLTRKKGVTKQPLFDRNIMGDILQMTPLYDFDTLFNRIHYPLILPRVGGVSWDRQKVFELLDIDQFYGFLYNTIYDENTWRNYYTYDLPPELEDMLKELDDLVSEEGGWPISTGHYLYSAEVLREDGERQLFLRTEDGRNHEFYEGLLFNQWRIYGKLHELFDWLQRNRDILNVDNIVNAHIEYLLNSPHTHLDEQLISMIGFDFVLYDSRRILDMYENAFDSYKRSHSFFFDLN